MRPGLSYIIYSQDGHLPDLKQKSSTLLFGSCLKSCVHTHTKCIVHHTVLETRVPLESFP
jgi:hypothetical protein